LEGFTSSKDRPKESETRRNEEINPDSSLLRQQESMNTRLVLTCDGAEILKVYVDPSMEWKSQTVMVSDGARDCNLRIDHRTSGDLDQNVWETIPFWYVNYTIFHGDKDTATNNGTTPIFRGDSYYDNGVASFDVLPRCYFDELEDHIDRATVYAGSDPSSKAIQWLKNSTGADSNNKADFCQQQQYHKSLGGFVVRYALAVLGFASTPVVDAPPSLAGTPSDGLSFPWIDRWGQQNEEDPCSWPGIVCVAEDPSLSLSVLNDVFYLDLSTGSLSGTIATEIGMLSQNLALYDVSDNSLAGSIPTEIGLLSSRLRHLDLSVNRLTGSIPTEVGLLSSLTKLAVAWNTLTGSIPTEIGFLTNLESLEVGANALGSSIPTEIGKLTALTTLEMTLNAFTGTIPTEFGLLTALKKPFSLDPTA
jgi:hypothetical protein